MGLWSPKTSIRKTGRPQTMRSTWYSWGKRRRDVSSFSWRLCSYFCFVLICSLVHSLHERGRASCKSGDLVTPRAANSRSQHSALHQRDHFFLPPSLPLLGSELKRSPGYSDLIIPPISWVKSIISHAACVGHHLTANLKGTRGKKRRESPLKALEEFLEDWCKLEEKQCVSVSVWEKGTAGRGEGSY